MIIRDLDSCSRPMSARHVAEQSRLQLPLIPSASGFMQSCRQRALYFQFDTCNLLHPARAARMMTITNRFRATQLALPELTLATNNGLTGLVASLDLIPCFHVSPWNMAVGWACL